MQVKLRLPENSRILVRTGDKVKFSDKIFTTAAEKHISIPVAKNLKIKPEKIYDYLKKLIDEQLEPGEVLAEKKGFFGSKRILSEHKAKIVEINHITGDVILSVQEEGKRSFSGLQGQIMDKSKDTFTIKLKDALKIPFKKTSLKQLTGAKISVIKTEKDIKRKNIQDKAVVIEKINPYLEEKIKALEAVLILTTTTPSTDIDYVVVSDIKSFNQLKTEKKEFILITPAEKVLYVYN